MRSATRYSFSSVIQTSFRLEFAPPVSCRSVRWRRDDLSWTFWYSPGPLLRTTTHFPSQARNEPSWGHNYSLNIPCSSTGFNTRYSPGVESHDCLHDTYRIPMLLHRFSVPSLGLLCWTTSLLLSGCLKQRVPENTCIISEYIGTSGLAITTTRCNPVLREL